MTYKSAPTSFSLIILFAIVTMSGCFASLVASVGFESALGISVFFSFLTAPIWVSFGITWWESVSAPRRKVPKDRSQHANRA